MEQEKVWCRFAQRAVVANKPREMTMCLVFMGCGVELTAANVKEGAGRSLGIRVIAIERFELRMR